jgi:hypothetical protein
MVAIIFLQHAGRQQDYVSFRMQCGGGVAVLFEKVSQKKKNKILQK